MEVSVARVSQIEAGDISTQNVRNRYVTALGGTLKLIADSPEARSAGLLAVQQTGRDRTDGSVTYRPDRLPCGPRQAEWIIRSA
jgi:hypothetical protein